MVFPQSYEEQSVFTTFIFVKLFWDKFCPYVRYTLERRDGSLENCWRDVSTAKTPAADSASVPWTYMAAHSPSSRESDTYWPLWAPAMQIVHRHTFGQSTHTHNRCQE